ncbi:MAG TPA: glycosyl hydrolase family 18 protein [bacterium]|nr:glycosyl hydrolase family 18 protein [bacterium]
MRVQGHRPVVPPRLDVLPIEPGRASVRPWLFFIVLGIAAVGAAWIELSPAFARDPSLPLLGVGYMVDDADSRAGLQRQGRYLNMVITTSFTLTDTAGTLRGPQNTEVVDLAHRMGMQVHFRVANSSRGRWGRQVAYAVLTYPRARAQAIANILKVLDVSEYDGVNLDLENIPPGRRTALTAFVTEVAAQVHQRGKTVSIAVPGKTVDEVDHNWSGAFDLTALGRVCDFVIVMAYDQHSGASGAGPVAALPWVEAVTQFATARVEREKLLLGLAFYGYVWPRYGGGIPISMSRAVSRAADAKVPVLWDERNLVPYYRSGSRTVYFEDARSLQLKLALAARERLAGVAMWRLGLEDPGLWEMMGLYVGRGRPAPEGPWGPPEPFESAAETATAYK